MITRAPEVPRLLHAWLQQQVEGKHELRMRSDDLAELARSAREGQKRMVAAILGTGLLIAAAVLYGLDAGSPRLWAIPAAAWIAALGGLWALLAAWPRR
ncbi:MAG: ubiquinone biosynthesis regulatory protein kinase UbiB, partial [Thermomonas sp.]